MKQQHEIVKSQVDAQVEGKKLEIEIQKQQVEERRQMLQFRLASAPVVTTGTARPRR